MTVSTLPHNHTDTSIATAHAFKHGAASLRALVYQYIAKCGLNGATYSEVKAELLRQGIEVDHSSLSPRFWELAGGNAKNPLPKLTVYLGERRKNPAGNMERAHVAASLVKAAP